MSLNIFKRFVKDFLNDSKNSHDSTLKSSLNQNYEFKVMIFDRKDNVMISSVSTQLITRNGQEITVWEQVCNMEMHLNIWSRKQFWNSGVCVLSSMQRELFLQTYRLACQYLLDFFLVCFLTKIHLNLILLLNFSSNSATKYLYNQN